MARFLPTPEKLEGAKHVLAHADRRECHIGAAADSAAPPGVDSQFFDSLAFTQIILQNPGGYGLVNVAAPCLANYEFFINGTGGQTPIGCSHPNEYLFRDGEHPSAKVHAVYASEVERLIGWG
jgi:hypothetical protein